MGHGAVGDDVTADRRLQPPHVRLQRRPPLLLERRRLRRQARHKRPPPGRGQARPPLGELLPAAFSGNMGTCGGRRCPRRETPGSGAGRTSGGGRSSPARPRRRRRTAATRTSCTQLQVRVAQDCLHESARTNVQDVRQPGPSLRGCAARAAGMECGRLQSIADLCLGSRRVGRVAIAPLLAVDGEGPAADHAHEGRPPRGAGAVAQCRRKPPSARLRIRIQFRSHPHVLAASCL